MSKFKKCRINNGVESLRGRCVTYADPLHAVAMHFVKRLCNCGGKKNFKDSLNIYQQIQ